MTSLLNRVKELNLPNRVENCSLVSPWKISLPSAENRDCAVVVYFYSDIWIPINCFSLGEAIALYQKALVLGKEILVYPPDLCPYTQTTIEKLEKQFESSTSYIKTSNSNY
jgi:hypothetical protein